MNPTLYTFVKAGCSKKIHFGVDATPNIRSVRNNRNSARRASAASTRPGTDTDPVRIRNNGVTPGEVATPHSTR